MQGGDSDAVIQLRKNSIKKGELTMQFDVLDTIDGLLMEFGRANGIEDEMTDLCEQIMNLLEAMLDNELFLAFQSGKVVGTVLTKLEGSGYVSPDPLF